MKFSIEDLRIKVNEKEKNKENVDSILGPEGIEGNISRFCNEVLVNEQEVGYGNFSWVYKDIYKNGLCYKKYKPNAEARMNITAHSEMNFMSAVHGFHPKVKTPYPMGLAEVVLRNNETNKASLVKVIAMEYFENATRLEDVIEPREPELKKEFPESFNAESFFNDLEDFVQKLHQEKGIFHRDLFARNVMIDIETGNPIVIDFGDASFPSAVEGYDAYGRPTYGQELTDKDLAHVQEMREETQRYIDKLNK